MQPDRPVQTTLAFHASRIVIDVGVLLAMASMSMTFVIAPGGDRSALEADALPALLLLLPIFLVTLIPDHTRPLHPVLGWASLVLALAAVPYAWVKLLDARVLADTLDGSVGLGPHLLLAATLVTLVGVGIGLFRDLMGWPSGGTPGRSARFQTGRSSKKTAQQSRQPGEGGAVSGSTAPERVPPHQEDPTRVVSAPVPAKDSPEEKRPAVPESETPPRQQRPTDFSASRSEIVFPETGMVEDEDEPQEPDGPHDLLDTAERADAALTDHLQDVFTRDDETSTSSEDEEPPEPAVDPEKGTSDREA